MKAARLAGLVLVAAMLAAGAGSSGGASQVERPTAADAKQAAPESKASNHQWGDGRAVTDPRDRPARGAPYNWRQMSFGVIVMAIMLAFVVWLVRRQTRLR